MHNSQAKIWGNLQSAIACISAKKGGQCMMRRNLHEAWSAHFQNCKLRSKSLKKTSALLQVSISISFSLTFLITLVRHLRLKLKLTISLTLYLSCFLIIYVRIIEIIKDTSAAPSVWYFVVVQVYPRICCPFIPCNNRLCLLKNR